jgi:hypothetical protein
MAAALERIARDGAARRKYLEFARDADEPAVQARMMALARELGWLSAAGEESELMQMLASRMRRDAMGPAEVALACSRTSPSGVSATARAVPAAAARSGSLAHAAVVACLGSMEARARVIDALASPRDDDVAIAEVYLRHRPLADAAELRDVAARIAKMSATDAQTRALAALAQQRVSDPETLGELARLFPRAKSLQVQRAIAGVLIRADYRLLETDDLARSLRQHRLRSPAGEDVIDVLIRRLQTSS